VAEAVSEIGYVSQFSYVLAYNRPVQRPTNVHGLVSEDDDHPLAWISFEHDKPGHVRSGTELIIVHTAPTWTAARVDRDPETFLPEVKAQAAEVLGTGLDQPVWYDTQRWRFSRPRARLPAEVQDQAADLGLYFAGDFVRGRGTVGAAIDSGFATARRLRSTMLT
jgi:predicted NAD/FAD-dependent oxidoreductase